MLSPSATVETVRALLDDTSYTSPELGDDVLDMCVQDAVSEYSGDRPRTIAVDVAGADTPFILLSGVSGWVPAFSAITAVEYPAGSPVAGYSPTFLPLNTDIGYYEGPLGRYLRLLATTPATGETLRLTFTVPHQLLATGGLVPGSDPAEYTDPIDTIPAPDRQAVIALAVSNACQVMANKGSASTSDTLGDGVNYRDAQSRWSAQAKAWRARYNGALGSEEGGSSPASRTTSWVTVPGGPWDARSWWSHGVKRASDRG